MNKYGLKKIFICLVLALIISPTFLYNDKAKASTLNNFDCIKDSLDGRLFDFKIRALMQLGSHIALSACIIKNDSIAWQKEYGNVNSFGSEPPTNKTIYLISSTTKPITTTALLQLYEQGLFDLDDDVNDYLPFSLRNPKYPNVNITFRILLSHRAGLFDHFLFSKEGRRDLFKGYLTSDLMESPYPWIKDVLAPGSETYQEKYWLDYAPGEDVMYSNTGFLILGYLLEIISGQTIEEYCQENIFKPLEMNDTSYHLEGLDETRVIRPFFRVGGVFIPLKSYDTKGFAGTCGVRTTIEDLSHFLIAHMNNGTWKNIRILNESTIKLMHNIQYYDEDGMNLYDYRYGLGWFETDMFGQAVEGHGGDNFGFLANMMMNRTSKTGFILLSAGSPPILGIFRNPISMIKSYSMGKAREQIGKLILQKAELI